MKKIFNILIPFAALSLLASCQLEPLQPDATTAKVILKEPAPGDMAEVTFTVSIPDAGVSTLTTRALSEQPNIASGDIYLALFGLGNNETTGRGGNLQHFLKASLKNGPISHDLTDEPSEGTSTHKYEYSVLLPISDEPYVIDFIVGASDESENLYTLDNPPAVEYENDFMSNMISRNGVPGYWQRVVIPKVEPKPKAGGGYETTVDGSAYIAMDIDEMANIQLVRNFAMVSFSAPESAKFTINKFVLVDYPKYGDIAPFDAAETVGYKTPYMGHNTNYAGIVDKKYVGYSTYKALKTGIAEEPTFTDAGEYSFLYERPAPSSEMPESGAVIEVTWKDEDGVDAALKGQTRYYKVAFTGESGYVPILRNIAYNFIISDFKTPTHPISPADAYNGSWLGDISANVATANLDEIENSASRIVVSEMSKTHIGAATTTPYSIYFQFYPDIATNQYADEVAVENGTDFHGKNVKVVASIEQVSGYDAAISSITQPVSDGSYASGATWGRVDVQTYGSGDAVRRSKLKILCQVDGQQALYREVIFTVMEKQYFNNGTDDSSIGAIEDAINQQTALHLRIPADLPKDIFPLQVRIEAQANNLTSIPVGNVEALPVKYGLSAFDNNKNSFYFIKTINWDDYAHLKGERYTYTTDFPCYFKTTLPSGNETAISLQDLNITSQGINEGKYFHEMLLSLGEGITVSPQIQTVAHNVTSATVILASSSAWTLGAHTGLTVASGSQSSGEAGPSEITFTFPENGTQGHKEYTATFTNDEGCEVTATIIQTALVPVTRTLSATAVNFNNNTLAYTGEFASELGISFSRGTVGNNYITIPQNGNGARTVTFSAQKISSIVITWYSATEWFIFTTYYNGSISTNGLGEVSNSEQTSSWTYSSGSDSVTLNLGVLNNRDMRIASIDVTYSVEQ